MEALLIGGCRTASGTPSRGVSGKGWRLSEGLREKIVSLATEDAARGVYMGGRVSSGCGGRRSKVWPRTGPR